MINASDLFISETFTTSDRYLTSEAVGVLYILTAVVGIFLNVATAILIAICKDMDNLTYDLMLHMCIVDSVGLIPVGCYSGVVLVLRLTNADEKFVHFLLFFSLCGLNALIVMLSLNRWLQLQFPHLIARFAKPFGVRMLIIFIYAMCLGFAISSFLIDSATRFDPSEYSWVFDWRTSAGNGLFVLSVSVECAVASVTLGFNLLSFLWIRRTRRQIQTRQLRRNAKAEVKLFIQCALPSTVYTCSGVFYVVVHAAGRSGPEFSICVHFVWLLAHFIHPIVYLIVNDRLRRRFLRIFCVCCTKEPSPSVACVDQPITMTKRSG